MFTFHRYVRTNPPVRTYIAKSPKRAIYAILYDTEVAWVKMTQATPLRSSSHFENLILVWLVLDILELLTKSIFENQSQLMDLKISNP